MKTSKLYRWLLVVPFLWQAALAPWSNGVHWRPFGLPFPMAWQMAGILVTTAVLWWVNRCDSATSASINAAGANVTSANASASTNDVAGSATP